MQKIFEGQKVCGLLLLVYEHKILIPIENKVFKWMISER